jgi:hypothetical protein
MDPISLYFAYQRKNFLSETGAPYSESITYVSYLLKDLREVEEGLAGLLEQAGHGRLVSHSDLALPHVQR